MALSVVNANGSSLGNDYNATGGAPGVNYQPTVSGQNLQTTADPNTSYFGSGGSGGAVGGTSYSAPVDPYAAWGGQAAYNNLVNTFDAQKQGVLNSATDQTGIFGGQYQRGILDFLDNQRLGQQGIDTKASRNELAKMQGVQGVVGSVGRGIKSSGVMLANRNAGDSSAGQALANAYGQQGRQQLSNIGNQYEMGNQDIKSAQDAFAVQQASGVRGLQGGKDDFVNKLALDTRNSLASLDAQIAGASLPNRIAIDQEKEAVKARALQQLQGYDAQLQSGVAGIQATNQDQRRAKASELLSAGTSLGADAFQYTDQVPSSLQGTGPFSSELPLFSLPRGKRLG